MNPTEAAAGVRGYSGTIEVRRLRGYSPDYSSVGKKKAVSLVLFILAKLWMVLQLQLGRAEEPGQQAATALGVGHGESLFQWSRKLRTKTLHNYREARFERHRPGAS